MEPYKQINFIFGILAKTLCNKNVMNSNIHSVNEKIFESCTSDITIFYWSSSSFPRLKVSSQSLIGKICSNYSETAMEGLNKRLQFLCD